MGWMSRMNALLKKPANSDDTQRETLYKPGDPWKKFPPNESDELRMALYERNKALFKCDHLNVFDRAREWIKEGEREKRLYIAMNFPRIISTLAADLLFSEPLRVSVPNNRIVQDKLRDILCDTNMRMCLYESALSGSYRGGAVLKARWTEREGPSIISVPGAHYFPHPDPDNQRVLLGETIAWIRDYGEKRYLRREIHTPGHVAQEAWLMKGSVPQERVPLEKLDITVAEELDTGCPDTLVAYIPNMRLDDEFWGESDYVPIENDLEALNERISKLHRVLNVHSAPVFVGPTGMLDETDSYRNEYEYDKENKDAIEVRDKETADIIRYVTWDAHLTAAFTEIDKLLDALMICAEISPDMFGMGKGGYAESGRALKMRWARQLAKRQRREMAYDIALRKLLRCAVILDNKFGRGPSISEDDRITILWGDGMPNDPKEIAEEEALLISAGISSRKSSHIRAMQAEEADAEREMAQIAKERRDELSILTAGSGGDAL